MKKDLTAASLNSFLSLPLLLIANGVFFLFFQSNILAAATLPQENSGVQFGQSYHNDVSPPLSEMAATYRANSLRPGEEEFDAPVNPLLPFIHIDAFDPVVDHGAGPNVPEAMPTPILNFDGMTSSVCGGCLPPDTNGAVGATQYVQLVNASYQVFNKNTGGNLLGPVSISALWSGFGGVCQTSPFGDPIVLYDKIANRWVISQFAGTSVPTDECIAVSQTSDATASYFRYAFHVGNNFFDYPKLAVWPDGYYMAMNVFDPSGTTFLGPQAFAFQRANMLTGAAATFVTPGISSSDVFMPSDLDGSILPTAGTGNPFVTFPGNGAYTIRIFHADFVTPANTTFNILGNPGAAGFTQLCPGTRNCVPQLGTGTTLDGIGDRLMFRMAYRKFADGHEAIVGNYSVSSGGVAGVRWFELRGVTTAPTTFQQSTYQPDSTWRWMGSAAMDKNGDIAVGFSASSSTINPGIRYAGRLVSDPANNLSQGEATLIAGTGSQTSGNRWGDYSGMTVDPVDDCTFWYTQEYYTVSGGNWHTRIGNFKFPSCGTGTPTPSPTPTATATSTATIPPTPTPTPTPTPHIPVTVSLPFATITTAVTNFTQPVTTTSIDPSYNLVGFQGDFTFDSTVITFQANPASAAGLTGTNWNVTAAIQPGGGPIRTLRISAFSNDFTPLSGSGTLFNLNMTRVSSTPGTNTDLVWAAPPNDFYFIDADLNSQIPAGTPPGNIDIEAGTINISGAIIYCSNATLPPVPGVTLTLTGTSSGSTSSDGSGNYTFSGLASGGNYTVTPSKAALAPGSSGISTVDVVGIQRHFLGLGTPLSGCRLTAADVNGSTVVDTVDVIATQRFFLGLSTGIANVGKYQFNPVNRSYAGVSSDQTGQNYNALTFGDIASPFVH